MSDRTATLVAVLKDAVSGPAKAIRGELDHLGKTSHGLAGGLGKAGDAMATFGKIALGVGVAAGAAAAAAIAGGVKAAADFEAQLNTINTVADVTPDKLNEIGDGIRKLARESGASLSDLTAGYYDLVSAGIDAADAQTVLSAANTLAVGGLATNAQTVDLLTTALNAYGMEASRAGEVADIFAQSIARGKVTADEIAASLATVAPLAAAAGIEIEEVAAGYATLTKNGVPAAEAATQMRAAIQALLVPNEALNRVQAQTGINFSELARTDGLRAAMEELRRAFAANGDALAQLAGAQGVKGFQDALKRLGPELGLANSDIEKFSKLAGKDGAAAAYQLLARQVGDGDSGFARALGSVNALSYALLTTGGNAAEAGEDFAAMADASGLAAEQAEKRQQGLNFQLDRLKATVLDIGITLGNVFLPVVTAAAQTIVDEFLPAIERVAASVEDWFTKNRPLIDQIGTLISGALTGLVIMVTTKIIPAMVAVSERFTSFALMIARDVGPVIVGVAQRFGALVELVVTKVVPVILDLAQRVWEGGANKVFAAFYKIVGSVIEILTSLVSWITSNKPLMEVLQIAAELIGKAFGFVADVISNSLDFLGGLGKEISKNKPLLDILAAIGNAIYAAFRAAAQAISSVASALSGVISMAQQAAAAIANLPGVGAIGDLLGGNRATGGPVEAGKSYIVGERGPEVFVPQSSGTILPNASLRPAGAAAVGGSPVVIPIVIDGREVARVVDENLFYSYRTAARTTAGV